jgi:outer membrane protein OmpA-like peptidoglycan-associated protein
MNDNPSYLLGIEGHTDNTGDKTKNLTLSQKRADAVKNYLVKKGIDASRLTAKGFGDTVPVADNKTADGRAKNRRVEFKVTF